MLYKFSHLLLYTVVLVGSYAIEAPTRQSLNSSSAPSAASNSINNLKAQLCSRRHVSKITQKCLIDGDDDHSSNTSQWLQHALNTTNAAHNYSCAQSSQQWQRCKRYTELLI